MLYPNLGSFDTQIIAAGGCPGSEMVENLHRCGREIEYWPFSRVPRCFIRISDSYQPTHHRGTSAGSEPARNLHRYGREIEYWPLADYRQDALCESYHSNLSLRWTIAISSHVGRHRRPRNGGWRIGLSICPRAFRSLPSFTVDDGCGVTWGIALVNKRQ
ncbi:hypothetical protein BDR22DRAFT_351882 [Usnea florida]